MNWWPRWRVSSWLPPLLLAGVAGCALPSRYPPVERQVVRIRKEGRTIDCGGKTFRGGQATELQVMADHVTIRNCTITGSIRTIGLGRVGESAPVRRSSRSAGHTRRAQDAAPSHLLVQQVSLRLIGLPGIYLGPGTTRATIERSRFTGRSHSVVIYLDAESARNTIRNNSIRVRSAREQVAVDGSAHNTIAHNVFHGVRSGGIFLYRNCGEGGTIRHQTPSHNRISHNRFPGSRHGRLVVVNSRNGNRPYCNDDRGYPFGSSADDRDRGLGNAVWGNHATREDPSR